MQLIPAIICGGTGSRLWPVSRSHSPKPFMRLGEGGSLLQRTFRRAAALPDVEEILTVTSRDHFLRTQGEYRPVNALGLRTTFILEPFGRDTAAAVAMAALHCVRAHGKNSVMLVLPADHLIENQESFAEAVTRASLAAQSGALAAIGIDPSSPHSGYGYIEMEKPGSAANGAALWHGVRRFVEKPAREKAEEFLRSGCHLWNSGMFCFMPGTLMQEMQLHCPEIVAAALNCLNQSAALQQAGSQCIELDGQSFSLVPRTSVDFAVMEKTKNIVVVHGQFGWSDVGTWGAVADLAQKDSDGNTGGGNSIFHQSSNCYVHGDGRAIGVVGLEDIVVVDAPDALLVAHRNRTQEVRHVFAKSEGMMPELQGKGIAQSESWGISKIVDASEGFKVRRLSIGIGQKLSRRDSAWPIGPWIVASGSASVVGQNGQSAEKNGGTAYSCGSNDQEIVNTGGSVLTLYEINEEAACAEDEDQAISGRFAS